MAKVKSKTKSKTKTRSMPPRMTSVMLSTTIASSVAKPSRKIDPKTTLFLYVHAGGRCEFDGCNKYLLEHGPTAIPGNFGEQAHIYAFKEGGPRGQGSARPAKINHLSNLMLLCPDCHHLVDSVQPQDFTVAILRKFKEDHEARVYQLTGLAKDRDTIPLVVKAQIAGRHMSISNEEMQSAVAPGVLRVRERVDIDLTALPDKADGAYWKSAREIIDRGFDQLQRIQPQPGRVLRVSVFALAPIPLLVYVGSKLTDKQLVEFYQRHREPETWNWHEEPGKALFTTKQLERRGDAVSLLVNVSGTNTSAQVSNAIGKSALYELTLDGQPTSPLALRTRSDLARFSAEYMRALARIRTNHPDLKKLHVFPAVPAPVALVLGRSRLPKVDPALVIYDRDDRVGGFVATLEL